MSIAPPPFAPFERRMLPARLANALVVKPAVPGDPANAPSSPPPAASPEPKDDSRHTVPGSDRVCPMCNKVHAAEARIELAA